MENILDLYVAAWSEQDARKRHSLLEQAWADDGVYEDPTASVSGRDALVAHIAGFHKAMPGAVIERTSGISHHHNSVYFAWQIKAANGDVIVDGVDFGALDDAGRLKRIVGFFGPPGS